MARETNASYEMSDNRRSPINGISTTDLAYRSFASLDEFVLATNSTSIATRRGYSFQFKDTTGWCPAGTANQWYRCMLVRYQNSVGGRYNVDGTILLASANTTLYIGEVNGTTTFTVNWTSIVDSSKLKIDTALSASLAMLNGHFIAGDAGWVGMTSHANGNTSTQYRVQLNNSGTFTYYTSTNGGETWTNQGNLIRSDQVSTWTAVSIAASSGYVSSIGHTSCYYNAMLKLATVGININIGTVPPNNGVLATGFPKSLPTRATFCISQGTATAPAARAYINQSGQLIADGAVPATGWYNGSITYPYSSL